ncbi:MAG: TauD/TfdA family dioxygenase [Pseudomonadales bacterium]|nr:TauD/TfdA family dioxygenase [Pseudomonadales bacterium]
MQQVKVEPYSGGCGGLVSGVDLGNLTDEEFTVVRDAFLQYGVIFFRHQQLSQEQHLALARRFGSIVINKFFPETSEYHEIAEVRKEPAQKTNIGGGWHTDHSYDEIPAMGSILVARELPSSGGDTLFCNMSAAFDGLSDGLKTTLKGLSAIHSNEHLYGEQGLYKKTDIADLLHGKDLVGKAVHPVVIEHPETGREILYVNPGHTRRFDGWSAAESKPLLDYLYSVASSAENTCRFRWEPGSVAIWDNRSTWHLAVNDYHGERRLLHRITIDGAPLKAAA